jgi:hypothetical protein
MTLIPQARVSSQDRILDYLAMRRRSHRRLVRAGWFFGILSLAGGYYVGGGYYQMLVTAFTLFSFFWFIYIVAASVISFIQGESQKRLAMERFIVDQGYRVDYDDLESRWVVRREM